MTTGFIMLTLICHHQYGISAAETQTFLETSQWPVIVLEVFGTSFFVGKYQLTFSVRLHAKIRVTASGITGHPWIIFHFCFAGSPGSFAVQLACASKLKVDARVSIRHHGAAVILSVGAHHSFCVFFVTCLDVPCALITL